MFLYFHGYLSSMRMLLILSSFFCSSTLRVCVILMAIHTLHTSTLCSNQLTGASCWSLARPLLKAWTQALVTSQEGRMTPSSELANQPCHTASSSRQRFTFNGMKTELKSPSLLYIRQTWLGFIQCTSAGCGAVLLNIAVLNSICW